MQDRAMEFLSLLLSGLAAIAINSMSDCEYWLKREVLRCKRILPFLLLVAYIKYSITLFKRHGQDILIDSEFRMMLFRFRMFRIDGEYEIQIVIDHWIPVLQMDIWLRGINGI